MSPARRWTFRLVAILLGFALPFCALEAYLRLSGMGGGFYEPDPTLGAWHIPNRGGRWRKACFDVPIRINSQGLRDVEHRLGKDRGTLRIAVLGDSIAEALQVPLEEAFPRRLETILNAGGMTGRAEVVNLAVSGFGTDQEYVSLKTRAAAYQPDVVVLVFTIGNDVRNNSPALEGQVSSYPKPFFRLEASDRLVSVPFQVAASSTSGPVGKIKALLRYFRSYDVLVSWVHEQPSLRTALARLGLVSAMSRAPSPAANGGAMTQAADPRYLDFEVYRRAPDLSWAQAWRVTEALLRATRDEASRLGARFVLVSIPGAIEFGGPEAVVKAFPAYTPDKYDLAGPRHRLERFAQAEGIDYVSIYDAFARDLRARGGKLDDLFFWCDGHLTPLGHRLVAEAIADRLRRPTAAPSRATQDR